MVRQVPNQGRADGRAELGFEHGQQRAVHFLSVESQVVGKFGDVRALSGEHNLSGSVIHRQNGLSQLVVFEVFAVFPGFRGFQREKELEDWFHGWFLFVEEGKERHHHHHHRRDRERREKRPPPALRAREGGRERDREGGESHRRRKPPPPQRERGEEPPPPRQNG